MPDLDVDDLGRFTFDERDEWYASAPVPLGALGGRVGQILFVGYDDDAQPHEFHDVARTFAFSDDAALRASAPAVLDYYRTTVGFLPEVRIPDLDTTGDVWPYVHLGDSVELSREPSDGRIYASVESECDWDPEHGLQLVFREGVQVTKVGPYDGENV